IIAAVPMVKRRLRGERFLIVGGRRVARRSNMVGVPFLLVRASTRMMDLRASGGMAGWPGYRSLPGTSGAAARRRVTGSTVLGGPSDHHTCGPTGRSHD